jgi:hypothetical protein
MGSLSRFLPGFCVLGRENVRFRLQTSEIPKIWVVCPFLSPDDGPNLSEIIPDCPRWFQEDWRIIPILQENKEDSTLALTSCTNPAVLRIRGLKLCKKA